MDGRTDGRTDGWMDGWIAIFRSFQQYFSHISGLITKDFVRWNPIYD